MGLQRLYNFSLMGEETWGVATEKQIDKLSEEIGYPVWEQTLASFEDVQDYMCEGGEIPEGEFLECEDGFVYIDPETYEMDFYPKSAACIEMLEGILETYV